MDMNALLPLQCYDGAACWKEYIQTSWRYQWFNDAAGVQREDAVGVSSQRLTLKADPESDIVEQLQFDVILLQCSCAFPYNQFIVEYVIIRIPFCFRTRLDPGSFASTSFLFNKKVGLEHQPCSRYLFIIACTLLLGPHRPL
jgi:hypothetical protein